MGDGGVLSTAIVSAIVSALVVIFSKYVERSSGIRIQELKAKSEESLARMKLESDIKFRTLQKTQDLAQEILSAFYRARDSIMIIRSPFSSPAESANRVRPDGEPDGLRNIRDAYFAILARYESRRAEFADLRSKKYSAIALFGAEVDEPFNELDSALHSIITSASLLVELSSEYSDGALSSESRRKMEADIWRHSSREDAIGNQVDCAIRLIEDICRPIVQSSNV